MLNVPGLVWVLAFIVVVITALVLSEPLGEWLSERRQERAKKAAIDATLAVARSLAPHPAGDGAQGAKSGEGVRSEPPNDSFASPTTTTSRERPYDPDKTVLTLSARDYAEFQRIINNPPEPNEALKKLLRPKPKSPPNKKPAKRKKARGK